MSRSVARRLPAPLYRVVRQARNSQAIRGYPERRITRSYGHGVQLTLSIQDPLAAAWYDHDDQRPAPEIEAARAHGLTDGACVFDIGAR